LPVGKDAILQLFRCFVRKELEGLPDTLPLWYEEWAKTTHFDQTRIAALRKADASNGEGAPPLREAGKLKTFVKSEEYPKWKEARLINPRYDNVMVFLAKFFKSVEQVVYDHPFGLNHCPFIKHVPVPERPALVADLDKLRQVGGHIYETDFTAFESHFVPEFYEICECQLYRHCGMHWGFSDHVCDILKGKNRLKTHFGQQFEISGRRMSGDACTSLGNGFTNLMITKFLISIKGGHYDGYVEGDDGIFFSSVELTSQDYLDLGFTCKIVEHETATRASFCGIVCSDSLQIIRNPRRFVSKFGWTNSFVNAGPKIKSQLLRAKALSAIYEAPSCPIVSVLARQALRKTRHVLPRFISDGYHDACPLRDESSLSPFAPTNATRELFFELYGLSPATQLFLEDCIRNDDLTTVGNVLAMPVGKDLSLGHHSSLDMQLYVGNYIEIK